MKDLNYALGLTLSTPFLFSIGLFSLGANLISKSERRNDTRTVRVNIK